MKRTKQPTVNRRGISVIVLLIIILVTVLEENGKQVPAPVPTVTAAPVLTLTFAATTDVPLVATADVPVIATADVPADVTIIATVVLPSVTFVPAATRPPLATDLPGLEITRVAGVLYDVTGTVNALGCPDSRCRVIEVYKKNSIIVVTGLVTGTTYKNKKTRQWVQVIFHDGTKVYVHGEYVTPYGTATQPDESVVPTEPVSPVGNATPAAGYVCPRTCTEARKMGLSPEEAAQCPGLDANHDGVACY